jgi:predicted AAA+ superfamily ATPase
MRYLERFADGLLRDRLRSSGAVLIQGAKGCGKTETAARCAGSSARMDVDEDMRALMELSPGTVLAGPVPRLIDEWQEYPQIWSLVRRAVDDRRAKGQFILTGSATPEERVRLHSGAGRFSVMKMRSLSLFERGWSTGEVSLLDLAKGGIPRSETVDFDLKTLAERLTLGGWPGLIGAESGDALRFVRDYVTLMAEVDTSRVGNKRRDPHKVMRLLQSLARNLSTEASLSALARDTGGSDVRVSDETIAEYLDVLERLMAVERLPAWKAHIRSADTLRKSPKHHFVDPSLAVGALGLSTEALLADLNYFGLLFESLAIRDLRIYAEAHDGRVFHYRDSRGMEIDAIVEYPHGAWAAFEVKMGFSAQDQAAANLRAFSDKIDQEKMGPPSALTVISANGFACRRKDGVNVVPLSALTA